MNYTARRHAVPGALPLRLRARERQEGRPDVRPAHAGRAHGRRHGRHRHAARRAVPRRRREGDPQRPPRRRPARGRHRPGAATCSTAPASRPASWCCARTGPKPAERRGKVLFINADREFTAGRAQNYLLPEHVEKIVARLPRRSTTSPASPASSTATSCASNDYNLNIRRYADNAPPPEPHDVRAHLHGGVPRREVEAKADAVRRARLRPPTRSSSTATTTTRLRPTALPRPTCRHWSPRIRAYVPGRPSCTRPRTAGGRTMLGSQEPAVQRIFDDGCGRHCWRASLPSCSRSGCWTGSRSPA